MTEKLKGPPGECRNCGRHQHLHVGILHECPGGRGFYRAKFDGDGDLETEYTDVPVCPWCGKIYVDDDYEVYEEAHHEVECGSCEKSFKVKTMVSYLFTTERAD